MQREFTYHFRTIKPADLDGILQSLDNVDEGAVRSEFEHVEKDGRTLLRRKPVTISLNVPTFAQSLPALAQDVIVRYIADYVKAMYVEAFQPVGAHDWDAIETYAASRGTGGRRAEFDISKEMLEAAADSLGRYMAAKLGNKVAGEKFRATVIGKMARSAIHRNIGKFDGTIIDKLLGHLEGWLEYVAANEADDADDHASVYAMLESKLKAHKGTSDTLIADML